MLKFSTTMALGLLGFFTSKSSAVPISPDPTSPHSSMYKMDILAILDQSMFIRYGNWKEAKSQVSRIVESTAKVFKNPVLGQNRIDLKLIDTIESPLSSIFLLRIVDRMENTGWTDPQIVFRNPVKEILTRIDPNVVVLFTRENLGKKERPLLSISANLGTICVQGENSVVVKDIGTLTSLLLAHELGHLLNMSHVDSGECGQTKLNETMMANHVMVSDRSMRNATPSYSPDDWTWSVYSQTSLRSFLQNGKSGCLLPKTG